MPPLPGNKKLQVFASCSHSANFAGTESFYYRADDIHGAPSGIATVYVTVLGPNNPPTGSVTISGIVMEEQTLSVSHNLADADGMGTVSYQWRRAQQAISGQTGTQYQLQAADVGQTMSVVASYTDGRNKLESVTSAETAAVQGDIVPTRQVQYLHSDLLGSPTASSANDGMVK